MKTLIISLTFCLSFFQNAATLELNDLDPLTNQKWTGTLNYLDYTLNKIQKIPTELTVTATKEPGVYLWTTSYPLEASHNSVDQVIISKDGNNLDGETVKSREKLADGTLKIVTQKEGEDNRKPASLRFTYLIGKTTFSRKKEICFKGESAWFTRNELLLKNN